ncbi:hydroxymethylbilane synthase [Demequina muriae]|uniref:Porphobilinogen deaminase n=1 Tax=Demequina muriae TaxID=3051664 RepID=A0ABT8GJ20_9MICO|nr:hydroxymethylbilane synthase [Demequina sp. EGI L300058]MDN4481389.1 hydroxymethylbilane synthase [Demequina sp. EGI L300058]
MKLRLGTRASLLARTQSGMVADALMERARETGVDLEVELVEITTHGDISRGSLVGLSEVGVFVAALREGLLDGTCDLAVHSLKDMPTQLHPELELAAVSAREDVRDALCTTGPGLRDLPEGAAIGTGSPRRGAQLLAVRPDLRVEPLRGNVDTRLGRVGDDLDGVVLAAAGLARLGRLDEATELIDPEDMMPAPGQGALAIEILPGADAAWADIVRSLDDAATRAAVTAERSLLGVLDAGCSAPIGAYATVENGQLSLRARVVDVAGTLALNESARGPASEAASLGRSTGWTLLGRGAARLMGRN